MSDWPTELFPVPTMRSRPDPPVANCYAQVLWYHVHQEGHEYVIRAADDTELLRRACEWADLCDELRWYPLDESGFQRPSYYESLPKPKPKPATKAAAPATRSAPVSAQNLLDFSAPILEPAMPAPMPQPELAPSPIPTSRAEPPRINYSKPCIPKRLTLAQFEHEDPQVDLAILLEPFPERPTPPPVGENIAILKYTATCKTKKHYKDGAPHYYLYNYRGEVLSMADNWSAWCHILGWYPLDGLGHLQPIPREEATPKRANGPHVVNRHWYATRDEMPDPWMYVGRGTPLGNPYKVEDHGIEAAMKKYRLHLYKLLVARDPAVFAEMAKITVETSLVCSCKSKPGATNPCHADEIVKAWRWLRRDGLLEGHSAVDSVGLAEWGSGAGASESTMTQTGDLFGAGGDA